MTNLIQTVDLTLNNPAFLLVNSAGLVLDIAGIGLLFWFGLPAMMSESGEVRIVGTHVGLEEIRERRRYRRWSRVGLFLIILGFLSQILSNFMQGMIATL